MHNAEKRPLADGSCAATDRVPLKIIMLVLMPVILIISVMTAVETGWGQATPAADPATTYFLPYVFANPAVPDVVTIENLGATTATADVYLSGYGSIPCGTIAVNSAVQLTMPLATSETGYLRVTSASGQPLLVSHMYEIQDNYIQAYATRQTDLDTAYDFPYYDYQTTGMQSQFMVANPGTETTTVSAYVGGTLKGTETIDPGKIKVMSYPATMGGPARIVSTDSKPILASQIIGYNDAWSDSPGTPGSRLSDHYFWPEYDSQSTDFNEWLYVQNPSSSNSIYYDVMIGGVLRGSGTVAPGEISLQSFADLKSGPVEVQTWTDSGRSTPALSLTSLRTINKNKVTDEPGILATAIGTSATLAWHDGDPATRLETVLNVANTGPGDASVAVYVGSSSTPTATATIPADSVTDFPMAGVTGGPVRVICSSGQNIVAKELIPMLDPVPVSYYLPWYDDKFCLTWIMAAQPSAGSAAARDNSFDLSFTDINTHSIIDFGGNKQVARGETKFNRTPGKIGGPVRATSSNGEGLVSERSLYGGSFEEIWATPYEDLDSHYWWPMYDWASPGMMDWIMLANPQESTENIRVRVKIYINSSTVRNQTYDLAPGETQFAYFQGLIAGPVEVTSWRLNGSENNPADARKVIASQRVLYGNSFNEMPGLAASRLSETYMWTWYDNISPGAANDILITNPDNSNSVFIILWIGDPNAEPAPEVYFDTLRPLETTMVSYDGMGGPVFLMGTKSNTDMAPKDIVASQRVYWGPSFGEIGGTRLADMMYTTSNWTWYDQSIAGVGNWVMVTNPQPDPIDVEIRIGGVPQLIHIDGQADSYRKTVAGYSNITPAFPGVIGGPVEVEAWVAGTSENTIVFASQRVLWNGYFNEVIGKGL